MRAKRVDGSWQCRIEIEFSDWDAFVRTKQCDSVASAF